MSKGCICSGACACRDCVDAAAEAATDAVTAAGALLVLPAAAVPVEDDAPPLEPLNVAGCAGVMGVAGVGVGGGSASEEGVAAAVAAAEGFFVLRWNMVNQGSSNLCLRSHTLRFFSVSFLPLGLGLLVC